MFFFFFNDTATTEIYTLSLHDALPISHAGPGRDGHRGAAAGPTGHGPPPPAGLFGPDARRHRLHGPRAVRAEHASRPEARRSEEHTSELQSPCNLVCRLLLEKKKKKKY